MKLDYERDEVVQRKVVRAMVAVLGAALVLIPAVYAYNTEKEPEVSGPLLVKIPKEDAMIYARACEREKNCVIELRSGERLYISRVNHH